MIQLGKKNLQGYSRVIWLSILFVACGEDKSNDDLFVYGESGTQAVDPMIGSGTGGAGSAVGVDTGSAVGVDAGNTIQMIDSGASPDGNMGIVDTGLSFPDTGTVVADTGTAVADTGTAVADTGTVAVDAVVPITDSSLDADSSANPDSSLDQDAAIDAGPPACSDKPGLLRGRNEETVMAAGVERSFIYYAPADLDPNTPVPLVIIPHGSTMSGEMMYDLTEYAALADREKFVVIFPDGIDGPGSFAPWNVGDDVCGAGAIVAAEGDDQAFMDELIALADEDQCIDHDHIFMTGFSMGGFFSNESACLRSDLRAIAPHSGGTHDLSACPGKIIPVLIMHFYADSLILYDDCATFQRDQWVQRNGCDPSDPEVRQVNGGSCEYYNGCPADAQVAFCTFLEDELPGGLLDTGIDDEWPRGHAWSGGSKEGTGAPAAISTTESATELGWAFFKEFAW